MQKKGNVSNIAPAIIILVVAAATLFFGLILTENLKTTSGTYSYTVVNESMFFNSSGDTFNLASSCAFNSPAVVLAINGSSGATISAGNYTIVGNSIYNASAAVWSSANVTYSYKAGSVSCDAVNKTISGLGTFADFWSIIVLAIVISVVIGILLIILSSRKVK